MSMAFAGESAHYRSTRDRLLERETALRRATEDVAAARRELPLGGEIPEDYHFAAAGADGTPASVRMSELFQDGKDTLMIYNFMFGPEMEHPCPSCSAFLDGLDGVTEHASQRINLAVVAKSPLPRILAAAAERGWRRLRLLSSAGNTYNRDYYGESESGSQLPMLNVFRRHDGAIHHFWGSELLFAPSDPGQDPRHADAIDPLWNMFDFIPEGRGTDWYPKLRYA